VNDEVLTPGGMKRIFLLPGELCVTKEPTFLATLLGSCVAVCIYNRHTGAAGMNHFIRDRMTDKAEPQGKFGDTSTSYLIKSLLGHGRDDRPL